jgi:FHA domain
MPHIVIKCEGLEIDRRELTAPLVIGRAPDCDLAVRDILLSRRHCRLEEHAATGWTLIDLASKNGTFVNGQKLTTPHLLAGYDVIQIGRARIIYYSSVPDENIADRLMAPGRPADPNDSLSGTLTGFTLLLPGESEGPQDMPFPKPRPKDPQAYEDPDLHDMLRAIASSSWDSIYSEARQQTLDGPTVASEDDTPRRLVRPRSPIDLSLQVSQIAPPEPVAAAPSTGRWRRMPMWRGRGGRQNSSVALAVCLVAALTLMKYWTGWPDRNLPPAAPAASVVVHDVKFISPATQAPPRISLDGEALLRAGKATAALGPSLLW